ncbi:MAG: RNA repair domain-containing protein [archaeon YNP-LCB-003-016]|jgi:uncharacterized protein (UPF0248 family)|uniref:RNA repair domain-containing protein n=1 Tax=Candidatus Culexarchaeum yellowstonense TaxID=2928963 RepID=UPI0026F08B75|nr:RNA repair domain-containing protein [Candidatus Culexarchaeum yellowstonense]MCC6017618.1 RNA repair domain-containing protein [Candidatus Verstraetearchaeota archaeon]MCR6669063.1 RNA repair domain-containing protein [Candidatus Culexarchaeum yellowstonense]MCR6690997.1 RNA repair domain-containing protein [Candidatus Culexarchaeum yellowstonense]
MPKFTSIRDVLNRICWHPSENRECYEVIFIHRGAPDDLKSVSAKAIVKVRQQSFEYKEDEEKIVYIPFHRIVAIRNIKTGKVVWRSRKYKINKVLK